MIITNFHLYLIQLWCQFFQNFVYGDVVYAQTWEVLTLKNCIEPPYALRLFVTLFDLALFPVGPFLPECLDVMNIPTSQIQNLTVHLSGECHLFCDRFISNSHFCN